MRRTTTLLIGFMMATVGLAFMASPADAQADDRMALAAHSEVIAGVADPDPNAVTSWLAEDAAVWDIEVIGNTVYVGGTFTTVTARWDTKRTAHSYLAAFDGSTGKWIDRWLPELDGPVYSLDTTASGDLIVGGEFATVNGRTDRSGLVALDPATAQVVNSFDTQVERRWSNGQMVVRDLFTVDNRLYVAGNFNHVNGTRVFKAVRLNRTSGVLDSSFIPQLTGRTAYTIAESTDGARVHIGGQFDAVNGVDGTGLLATVHANNAQAVEGWTLTVNTFCCKDPKVLALAVAGDNLFITGVNDYWAMLSSATGEVRRQVPQAETQDVQVVEVFGDRVYLGCHCSKRGDWVSVVDAQTGADLESFSAGWGGSDGGWALALAPDGCLWAGGAFDSALRSDGSPVFAGNLIRTCPSAGLIDHDIAAIDPPPPPAPFECEVSAIPIGIDISWTDLGARGYDVIEDGGTKRWTKSESVADVTPGTNYEIVAWGNGHSGKSTSCTNAVPGNAGGFTCTIESLVDGSILIKWTDLGAKGYDVLEDDQAKSWTRLNERFDSTPGDTYKIVAWGNGFSGTTTDCQ